MAKGTGQQPGAHTELGSGDLSARQRAPVVQRTDPAQWERPRSGDGSPGCGLCKAMPRRGSCGCRARWEGHTRSVVHTAAIIRRCWFVLPTVVGSHARSYCLRLPREAEHGHYGQACSALAARIAGTWAPLPVTRGRTVGHRHTLPSPRAADTSGRPVPWVGWALTLPAASLQPCGLGRRYPPLFIRMAAHAPAALADPPGRRFMSRPPSALRISGR